MGRGIDILNGMPAGRRAVRSLLALGAIVVTIVVLGGCALLAFAAVSVDRLQAREEHLVVRQTLERSLLRLDSDVAAAAVWDQAFETIRPGVDLGWMDSEMGSYYANNRGDDLSVVLDSENRPFYAWVDQGRATPASQAALVAAAAPLIAEVRRQETAAAKRPRPTDPTVATIAETAHGVVRADGRVYLVALSTITPEKAARPRARRRR